MKFACTFIFSLLTSYLFCQLSDCDIWLLDIKDSAGNITFHNPLNITNRKGYDNQPAFSPDGKYLLYTSQRDSAGQTDIYKYTLETKTSSRFTKTPESEYSPSFLPDGSAVSVVRVEKDSVQRLWKFPLAGGEPACIAKNVDSVAYYSWINKDSIAVFILTKPVFTLQVLNIRSQKARVLADSIGRCIRMHQGNLWFTVKSGRFCDVYEYSFNSQKQVWKGMIESEDFCFYGKAGIWYCSENSILSGFMTEKEGAGEIADLSAFGITKPSRIALSPDGKKLAVVSTK